MTTLKRSPTNTDATANEMGQGPACYTFSNFIKTKYNTKKKKWSPDKDRQLVFLLILPTEEKYKPSD